MKRQGRTVPGQTSFGSNSAEPAISPQIV